MSTKDTLFDDLDTLEKKYPGLNADLEKCKTKRLQAYGKGYRVFSADTLTTEEKAQVKALEGIIANLRKVPGDNSKSISALALQIKTIKENKTQKAWNAAMAVIRPSSGTSVTSTKESLPDGVYRMAYKDDTLFGTVLAGESELYKIDGTASVKIERPSFLRDEKPASTSALRAFANMYRNGTTKKGTDGHGQPLEGIVGGTLCYRITQNVKGWIDNPANFPDPLVKNDDDESK